MYLEDYEIYPRSFSDASVFLAFKIDETCELFIPCLTEEESEDYKEKLVALFGVNDDLPVAS